MPLYERCEGSCIPSVIPLSSSFLNNHTIVFILATSRPIKSSTTIRFGGTTRTLGAMGSRSQPMTGFHDWDFWPFRRILIGYPFQFETPTHSSYSRASLHAPGEGGSVLFSVQYYFLPSTAVWRTKSGQARSGSLGVY